MHNKSKHIIAKFLSKEFHRHPYAVPVVTFLLLSFVSLFAVVLLGARSEGAGSIHVVQLTVEGERQTLPTRAVTVKDLLNRVNVTLHEGDVVEPAADTPIDAEDFRVNVYRAKPVTILDGEKRIQAKSAASTPRSIAAQVGVRVHAEDNIEYAKASDALRDQVLGTELIIDRAVPVELILYGTPVAIRTHVSTIEELLQEKNIVIAPSDTLSPGLDAPISEGMIIQINRQGTKIVTETEVVDNTIEYLDDDSLSFGTTAVRQAGSPGKKVVTYQLKLKNGKEIGRKKIQEVISQAPINRIIARGKAIYIPADKSQIMAAAGLSPNDYPYANYIISNESGWCPTKWQGQIGYCPPYYEPIHSSDSGFGYGLCQATPAGKMASAGDDWKTSTTTQLKWCTGYAEGRYGSWAGAYEFWTANHWW